MIVFNLNIRGMGRTIKSRYLSHVIASEGA